jgi:hypothetical protein
VQRHHSGDICMMHALNVAPPRGAHCIPCSTGGTTEIRVGKLLYQVKNCQLWMLTTF